MAPRCWHHPSWVALWQMLPASVGWGAPWGRDGEDVHIHGDTLVYTYLYMCTCLCVSSIKTAVHLVVLVCTLIWLNKTFVLQSMWNQGISKDSVCGSSAVVVVSWDLKKSCINQRWKAITTAWKLKHLWEAVVYSALFVYFVWEINLAILVLDLCMPFIQMLIHYTKS